MAVKAKRARKVNIGGWKTCSRGHKFRGPGPCPVCWPGGAAKRAAGKPAAKRAI